MPTKSIFSGLLLVALGVLFLLSNHDMLPPLGPLFHKWWPLLLIFGGIYTMIRRSKSKEEQP